MAFSLHYCSPLAQTIHKTLTTRKTYNAILLLCKQMIQKYQKNRLGYSCRFFTFSSNTNQPSILQGIKTSEKPKILPVIIGNLLPSLKHNFLSHILLFYSACSVYECTASREEWRALIQPILLPSPPKPTLCPCASDDNAGFEWL